MFWEKLGTLEGPLSSPSHEETSTGVTIRYKGPVIHEGINYSTTIQFFLHTWKTCHWWTLRWLYTNWDGDKVRNITMTLKIRTEENVALFPGLFQYSDSDHLQFAKKEEHLIKWVISILLKLTRGRLGQRILAVIEQQGQLVTYVISWIEIKASVCVCYVVVTLLYLHLLCCTCAPMLLLCCVRLFVLCPQGPCSPVRLYLLFVLSLYIHWLLRCNFRVELNSRYKKLLSYEVKGVHIPPLPQDITILRPLLAAYVKGLI